VSWLIVLLGALITVSIQEYSNINENSTLMVEANLEDCAEAEAEIEVKAR
jgi:uncharacterized BrkB/YihY/UPF0761 family membrane protein